MQVDIAGIGFGPANIALAAALEEMGSPLSSVFFERLPVAGWQEGMLLPDADIQNHPLRDLVTPRNPRSKYSFTNFLFEQGRLYEYLNLPLSHPLRIEYREYVRWVASHFEKTAHYGRDIRQIVPLRRHGPGIDGYRIIDSAGNAIEAGAIVLAPGRTPNIPPEFSGVTDERIVHLNNFLPAFEAILSRTRRPRIAVIGGSQTAVELLLHLAGSGRCGEVIGIHRGFGYRLKDTSPFSDEVYFPKFVDTFFHANDENKRWLRQELHATNYSSADRDVLDALYVLAYRKKLMKQDDLQFFHATQVLRVTAGEAGIALNLTHRLDGSSHQQSVDLVVLATGFLDLGKGARCEPYPALLASLHAELQMPHGALEVDFEHRVRLKNDELGHAPIYLNGLCESSHGMGDAGSFSLLALRSNTIAKAITADVTRHKNPACVNAAQKSASTGLHTCY